MANLTIPSPEVDIGKCPNCGENVKINPVWYQRLKALIDFINANL
jgi:hypothetical protein